MLRRSIDTGAGTCEITVSNGLMVSPGTGIDFKTLYKNADTALY